MQHHDRAIELMRILAACTVDELDENIISTCTDLIDKSAALQLISLRLMHTKYKDDQTILYGDTYQLAIEIVLAELEFETSHIQLDVCSNDE